MSKPLALLCLLSIAQLALATSVIEKSDKLIQSFRFTEARDLLAAQLQQQPQNRELLTQLNKVRRILGDPPLPIPTLPSAAEKQENQQQQEQPRPATITKAETTAREKRETPVAEVRTSTEESSLQATHKAAERDEIKKSFTTSRRQEKPTTAIEITPPPTNSPTPGRSSLLKSFNQNSPTQKQAKKKSPKEHKTLWDYF